MQKICDSLTRLAALAFLYFNTLKLVSMTAAGPSKTYKLIPLGIAYA